MKFRNYTIYKFCVLSIFAFIKQKTDKLIRDIRDFSFIIIFSFSTQPNKTRERTASQRSPLPYLY